MAGDRGERYGRVWTGVLPVFTLWKRELVRFVRDRYRLTGAVGQPMLVWLLFGYGLDASFKPAGQPPEMSYLEYIFPGTLLLIVLFTAIFSTITVVEDRREGFMQSVLAAPVPRSSLVLGKVLGGTTMGTLEGLIFLVFAFYLSIPLTPLVVLLTAVFLFLASLGLTGLGFAIAWRMESTAGFHAIMNLFLLPMWLLSGAFFPSSGVPGWLGWVIWINPMTYSVAGLRQVLYMEVPSAVGTLPPLETCVWIAAIFAIGTFAVSVYQVSRVREGSIR